MATLPRIDTETERAALIAACAGGGPIVRIVKALRAAGIAESALVAAERAGALRLEHGAVVCASAAERYARASGPARRAAHAALAASATDEEERLWHEANATDLPDDGLAGRLAEAALRVPADRGIDLLERAAELSATPSSRTARYVDAAQAAIGEGLDERAEALLAHARETASSELERARILQQVARAQLRRGDTSQLPELVRQARAIWDSDPDLGAEMIADAAHGSWHEQPAETRALVAEALREIPPSPTLDIARALFTSDTAGDAPRVLAGVVRRRGTKRDEAARRLSAQRAGTTLYWLERYELAREILRYAVEAARTTDRALFATSLDTIAAIETKLGNWVRAQDASAEALRVAREIGDRWQVSSCLSTLARVDAARGDAEPCRRRTAEALELAGGSPLLRIYALSARGLLCLGVGELDEAVAVLEELELVARDRGLTSPATPPGMPDLIETYLRLGRRDDARRTATRLAQHAEAGVPAGVGAVLARCRALASERADAEARFVDALSLHAQIEVPFERARTQLCYGEWLRRARRRKDARRELERALATFEVLGARPWADRARRELGRGAAARPESELTPHEIQVASLVSEGATNAETARALFVTEKTVEYHLAAVYRKLGVRNRAALAARWAQRER